MQEKGLFIEAMPLRYDPRAWQKRFLAQWPPGSDAHRSYWDRIAKGPAYAMAQAVRISGMREAPSVACR
jgi:hypothetical protein